MPRAKKSAVSLPKYLKLPKFSAPKSYTPILMVLLIVAAFFIGMLITKVQYLEGQSGGNTAGTQQAAAGNQTPPTSGPVANVAKGNFPALGNKDAKVVVVEYAD